MNKIEAKTGMLERRVRDRTRSVNKRVIAIAFEPHSETIRKGKASKPTEFGKLVQLAEAENQIVTRYDVFDQRPSDRELLTGAVGAETVSREYRRRLLSGLANDFSRNSFAASQSRVSDR